MGFDQLSRVFGFFKDVSSLGKACLHDFSNDSTHSYVKVLVIRATCSYQSRIHGTSMERLLIHVSLNPDSIPSLVDCISLRLQKTKNHRVALKTLLLIHRILCFDRQMHMARALDQLQLGCFWFMKSQDPFSVYLQNYAAFLKESTRWILNGSDHRFEHVVNQPESGREPAMFHILTQCQGFIEKVLACAPVNVKPIDNLVLAALHAVLEDSFKIYVSYIDELKNLLTMFFDMPKQERARACGYLRIAYQQCQGLRGFYEKCRESAVDESLEYPSVEVIDVECISSLEELTRTTLGSLGSEMTGFHHNFSSRLIRF